MRGLIGWLVATAVVTSALLACTGPDSPMRQHGLFEPTKGELAVRLPRVGHTATLLRDGKVLIIGGGAPSADDALRTAELFDSATGMFISTGRPSMGRVSHTATLLEDGRVLVAGGVNRASAAEGGLRSAEIYDPAQGTFTPTGEMRSPRIGHSAVLLRDDRVLITGGSGDPKQASAEIYDPVTGTFSDAGEMQLGRVFHQSVLLSDGQVFISGGAGPSEPPSDLGSDGPIDLYGGSGPPELYNPASGQFHLLPGLSSSSSYWTTTLLQSGQVLLTGGCQVGMCEQWDVAALYDPEAGTLTEIGRMTRSRRNYTATLLADGRVLLAGGTTYPRTDRGTIEDSAEIYDPSSRTFTTTGSMHVARYGHTAMLLPDGSVLVVGKPVADGGPDEPELFRP